MHSRGVLGVALVASVLAVGLPDRAVCGETQGEQSDWPQKAKSTVRLVAERRAKDQSDQPEIEKLIDEACLLCGRGHVYEDLVRRARVAQKELAGMGETVVPFLIARIKNGDSEVSPAFCAILPAGVPELIHLFRTDQDPATRARAAWVIGRLRGRGKSIAGADAHQALQEAVLEDEDSGVREQALWSLDGLRIKVDKDVLLKALEDEEAKVRRAAVYRVRASLERADAIEAMHPMTTDESAAVREAGGLTLCEYRDEAAVPLLIEAMTDENTKSWKAESALERWFRLRFYGEGPGQTKDRNEIKQKWRDWWEDNSAHIDRYFTITIRPGDTFSGLATRIYAGDTPPGWGSPAKRRAAIMAANPGIEPTKLIDGHALTIPRLKALDPDEY